ncbi:DUF7667 family protein [Paenibacillus senegalensis]|uniref:DUF7667 family protein n=1 Tax=Paenibacillus senegalensis TaxID=1465766 RepID=UPI0002884E84|nr:hypothetical protein [Paenibacillus senegalensis]
MNLNVVMQRIAELWTIQKGRQLTDEEYLDFTHAMNANAKYWWERAYLSNELVMATIAKNVDWQNEVLMEISHFDYGIKIKSRAAKDPGRKNKFLL